MEEGWSPQASNWVTPAGWPWGLAFHLAEVMLYLACRNRHLQRRQIQALQRARCLTRAWQLWVDVHWAEQLSRTLVGGLSSSPSCRGPGADSFIHRIPWPTLDKPVSRCGLWTRVRSPCLLTFLDDGPLVTSLSPWGGRSRRARAVRTRTAKTLFCQLSL